MQRDIARSLNDAIVTFMLQKKLPLTPIRSENGGVQNFHEVIVTILLQQKTTLRGKANAHLDIQVYQECHQLN